MIVAPKMKDKREKKVSENRILRNIKTFLELIL